MPNKEYKTLSAVITPDSVLSVIIDHNYTIHKAQNFEIEDFISKIHSGDFIDYQLNLVNAGNKFIHSDNAVYQSHEDFSVGLQKFTGQDIFVKFIQHADELKTEKHVSALIDHYYYLQEKDVIHLHFEKQSMHVYIKQNGFFILYNVFTIENANDVLYFCNLAFESINDEIKPNNKWMLSGLIDQNSVFETIILKYFPSFSYVKIPVTLDKTMKESKSHYYFLHYLNLVCE
jgi:hypothetical protein